MANQHLLLHKIADRWQAITETGEIDADSNLRAILDRLEPQGWRLKTCHVIMDIPTTYHFIFTKNEGESSPS